MHTDLDIQGAGMMSEPDYYCSSCKGILPKRKNYTRLAIWRRESPRKCRVCVDSAQTTHGETRTRLYQLRLSMLSRCGHLKCSNPAAYKYYINRGIVVCQEWIDSYEAFKVWAMANGYTDTMTIDRHPNKAGNYEPSNCRWVSMTENLRTRQGVKMTMEKARDVRKMKSDGASQKHIAAIFGISEHHVWNITSGRLWDEAVL